MLDTISPPAEILAPGTVTSLLLQGSHAYGLAGPSSDEDWRGIFSLPVEAFTGLRTPTTTYEQKPDIVLWESAQFGRMLIKGNPNVVGMLWVPDDCIFVEHPPMTDFRRWRTEYISAQMARAYIGWAKSEIGKAITPKQLSHLPRLLWEIEDAITTGEIRIRLTGEKLRMIRSIKMVEVPISEVLAFTNDLLVRVQTLADEAHLPDAPFDLTEEIVQSSRMSLR